jgi:hypothetical protein
MALSVGVTAFSWATADTAGTTYDVTLGFQPKCVVLFTTGDDSTTDSVGVGHGAIWHGFGTSSTNRVAVGHRIGQNAGNMLLSVRQTNTGIACHPSPTAADSGRLDIASEANWPSDGIRFVVDTQLASVQGTFVRIGVLAFGGSDITAQNAGSFQEAGATGNTTIAHGLGTTPTGALFASVGFGTAPGDDVSSATQGSICLGAFDGTNSWVVFAGGDDAAADSDTKSYAKAGEVLALAPEPAATLDGRASGVSFDATNITIDWLERASTRYCFYLAWAGGQFKVSNTTTRTDTTGFNGPTAGFVPTLAMFASACRAESTADTPTDHGQLSFGAATSASNRFAVGLSDRDASATSVVVLAVETDEVYANVSTSSSAVQGAMDVTDMTVDPMQLVMDVADPSASFVGVAMWGATGGGTSPTPDAGAMALTGYGMSLGFTIHMPDEL